MADISEAKRMNKNGILIYQLPSENVEDVLDCFPRASLLNYFHDEVGLHIYFHDADRVVQCAIDRVIEINGYYFNICFTVTNLTIHGIAPYIQDVEALMQSNGFEDIVDCYPVQELEEHKEYKSFKILPDFRVILNVPEIFANYELKPIRSPERPSYAFDVSFFCRLCRQNGHKTCECPKYFRMEPSAGNTIVNRISHESYSPSLKALKIRHFKFRNTASNLGNISDTYTHSSASVSFSRFQSCSAKSEPHFSIKHDEFECSGRQSECEISKSQPCLKREVSLSEGIKEAIAMTCGDDLPLSSDSLINFLNHVRNRKTRLLEITLVFTSEISRLVNQLESVEKNYYWHVQTRGADEDRDLRFLKKLRERLQEQINLKNEAINISQGPSSSRFKAESSPWKFQFSVKGGIDNSSDSD